MSHDCFNEKMVLQFDQDEAAATSDARELTAKALLERGYAEDDIQVDCAFEVASRGKTDSTKVDYLISIKGVDMLAIKCSMAMESRERHVLSFARAAHANVIPFAVITNGIEARVMDTLTGKVIGEGLGSIPSRDELLSALSANAPAPLDPARRQKETMVLMAFECTDCPSHPRSPRG